jgi:hypothetical protein
MKSNLVFIEGIVYSLLIIVTIIAITIGPIYIKFIPILYILGILGNMLFKRPIITSIFACIVSICIIQILGEYTLSFNILKSIYVGLLVFLRRNYIYLYIKGN